MWNGNKYIQENFSSLEYYTEYVNQKRSSPGKDFSSTTSRIGVEKLNYSDSVAGIRARYGLDGFRFEPR